MKKSEKILGKYGIREKVAEDKDNAEFIAYANGREFSIKRISKATTKILWGGENTTYSHLAKRLGDIQHKNLVNIKINEDDSYFYAITEQLEREAYNTLNPQIFKNGDEVDYTRLLRCYLQIFYVRNTL